MSVCSRRPRREFLTTSAGIITSLALPWKSLGSLSELKEAVRIGMIADLHHDVMHDGPERLQAFLEAMKKERPDAIIQLGDFAYPNKKNQEVTDAFVKAHPKALHVLGNHEIDDGHSFEEVAKIWRMKGRYYTENIGGLNLIVLDGNEKPSNHRGGYPAHIGDEQLGWLREQLKNLKGPIVVICHQPLAGPSKIDNAEEVQKALRAAEDKVILTVNGHTHIDHIVNVGQIPNFHVNSASYKWVGGAYRNKSYPDAIHSKFKYIEYTCPYRDSLFVSLSFDPAKGQIDIRGRETEWVGKSPSELGIGPLPDLVDGKEICPRIRTRQLKTRIK